MTPPKKILVRAPNWVGDAVLAVPAIKALREAFPDAEVTVLARPWVSGVFTSAPFVDKVWREPRPAGLGDWIRITRGMRARKFDTAILFPNSFESAAMVFLGGVPQRVGYATDGRRFLLTHAVPVSAVKRHQTDYYLELSRTFTSSTNSPSIDLAAASEDRARARKLLTSVGITAEQRYLVLNPGAAYGSAKRWGEERFAEVADTLAGERGMETVIVGSEMERSIAERLQGLMKSRAVILNGRTSLETLLGVLSESSLVVTNDSGPMHLAAALGVPVVAIFGSTDHTVTSPVGRRTRLVREPVDCSPCMLRECPIDHRCMTRVSADTVCRAARELIASGA